jgi:hypothetical protein
MHAVSSATFQPLGVSSYSHRTNFAKINSSILILLSFASPTPLPRTKAHLKQPSEPLLQPPVIVHSREHTRAAIEQPTEPSSTSLSPALEPRRLQSIQALPLASSRKDRSRAFLPSVPPPSNFRALRKPYFLNSNRSGLPRASQHRTSESLPSSHPSRQPLPVFTVEPASADANCAIASSPQTPQRVRAPKPLAPHSSTQASCTPLEHPSLLHLSRANRKPALPYCIRHPEPLGRKNSSA